MKKTVSIWFAKFMILMLVGTFVSRGIYAYSLPRVTTQSAKMMSLSHDVKAEGLIEKGMESAINILPELRVKEVYVAQGDPVVSGNQLFSLDLEDLQEKIQTEKTDLEKLNLQIETLTQKEQLEAAERAEKIKRANEDYALGIESARLEVNAANAALAEANARRGALSDKDSYIAEAIKADSQVQTQKKLLERFKNELSSLKKELKNITDTTSENDIAEEELNRKIKEKEAEISEAETALAIAENSVSHTAEETWKAQQQSLNDNVASQTKLYEETLQQEKEATLNGTRALQDASDVDAADNTKEMLQLEKEQLQKQLAKYQEILTQGGIVYSPISGVVSGVAVSVGDRTTDSAAMLLAGMDSNLRFTADITKKQQEYVSAGDKVEISFDSGKTVLNNVNVQSVEKSLTEEDRYRVSVSVPSEGLTIGKAGVLKCSQQTENYPICVPLSALHETGSQYYVFIAVESQTILGTEIIAERRDVVIADQNEKYAALDASSGIYEEQLIISTTKKIESGDKVRLKNFS